MLPGIYEMFQHWGREGAVWIYSDPHFGDLDLEEGIGNRPSDEEQIKNINSHAGRKDTLIILGDVGDISKVRQLRAARKVLIMGNHDAGATNYKRKSVYKHYDKEAYTREAALENMKQLYPDCKYTIWEGYDVQRAPFCYWCVEADNG